MICKLAGKPRLPRINTTRKQQGFALMVSLLLLLLLSALSVGLIMMVTSEGKSGGYDVQNKMAYHAAEGAIEKMTADLAASFHAIQAPTAADIANLSATTRPVSTVALQYIDYSFSANTNPDGSIVSKFGQISSGPNQGLYAQLIPVNLKATVQTGLGAQVTMLRSVEVALIPVFQFGVFSDSDLGFFNSPNLDFNGRIHTNSDLYIGVFTGNTMSFHDKVSAYGNVIRAVLPNGLNSATYSNTGTANIVAAANGCSAMPAGPPGPNCKALGTAQGSVVGGPTSAQNPAWPTISKGTFNGWIIDGNFGNPGGTGAIKLSLPFTNVTTPGGTTPEAFEIIRRPPPGEDPTTALSQARLYNQAEIRVLIVDDPNELPNGAGDPQNIRLANVENSGGGPDYRNGVPVSTPVLPALASGVYTTYFAEAANTAIDTTLWTPTRTAALPSDWPVAPSAPPAGHATLVPAGAPIPGPTGAAGTWNLIDGYLRVEYRDATGTYNPITREWLELGFARNLNPPTNAAPNNVNPNAILLFQKPADRNGINGLENSASGCGTCVARPPEVPGDAAITALVPYPTSGFFGSSAVSGSVTRNNWYPINFYDAREGEARDTVVAGASCTVNGIMNAVELDVNNLRRWLSGAIPGSGSQVVSNKDNGYILYFSDRRGMGTNPNVTPVPPAPIKTGDSGLEDVINTASVPGVPDRVLEPIPAGKLISPEDTNKNGVLDNFGAWNLGAAFGINTGTSLTTLNQYGTARIASCFANGGANPPGRKNWISGARHVVKLVNGTLGSLPTKPDGTGGFTLASENPVYINGDYNTSAADPTWATPTAAEPAHAAAAIIADSVTLFSNNWKDDNSLLHPTGATTNRPGVTTYYRVAIASGKNIIFPAPAFSSPGSASGPYGFGTDGGVHNFLRFLEDWNGQQLFYKGSLVSLYYATYNTGTFKCCNDAVYHPPTREYVFDPLFLQPQNLPPGTPMFRDVDNLSYRQDFTPY